MNPADLSQLNLEEISLSDFPPGILICSGIVAVVFWGGFWAIFAFFFQKNLRSIPESHRLMAPWKTWWLVPIPLALVVLFPVVSRIADSWKSFFDEMGDATVGDCGKKIGLTCAALALVSNLLSVQPLLGGGSAVSVVCQIVSIISGLIGFILLIVFSIRINDLRHKAARICAEKMSPAPPQFSA